MLNVGSFLFLWPRQHTHTHTRQHPQQIDWHLQHAYNVVMAAPQQPQSQPQTQSQSQPVWSVWRLGIPNFIAVHCKIFTSHSQEAEHTQPRIELRAGAAGLFL